MNEAGSRWQNSDGDWNVAYLDRNGDKRDLNLNWLHNDFNPNYRFLVSRQSLHTPPTLRRGSILLRRFHLSYPATQHCSSRKKFM